MVHLAVIPPAESWHLHLLAITADGRRVFCTTRVSCELPAESCQPNSDLPHAGRLRPPLEPNG